MRPNASVIEPGALAKVSIILQGFSQPLPKDYKCKDKFLLVSLPAPNVDDPSRVGELWASLEAKHKALLVSKKLRVNYVIGEDSAEPAADTVPAAAAAAVSGSTAAAVSQLSPIRQKSLNGSSQPYSGNLANKAVSSPARAQESFIQEDITLSPRAYNQTANNTFANSNFSSPAPKKDTSVYPGPEAGIAASPLLHDVSNGDDQRELDRSTAQINQLSEKLDSNERGGANRSRTAPVHQSEKTAVRIEEPVNGIPLSYALVLIIIAFLTGWLIF